MPDLPPGSSVDRDIWDEEGYTERADDFDGSGEVFVQVWTFSRPHEDGVEYLKIAKVQLQPPDSSFMYDKDDIEWFQLELNPPIRTDQEVDCPLRWWVPQETGGSISIGVGVPPGVSISGGIGTGGDVEVNYAGEPGGGSEDAQWDVDLGDTSNAAAGDRWMVVGAMWDCRCPENQVVFIPSWSLDVQIDDWGTDTDYDFDWSEEEDEAAAEVSRRITEDQPLAVVFDRISRVAAVPGDALPVRLRVFAEAEEVPEPSGLLMLDESQSDLVPVERGTLGDLAFVEMRGKVKIPASEGTLRPRVGIEVPEFGSVEAGGPPISVVQRLKVGQETTLPAEPGSYAFLLEAPEQTGVAVKVAGGDWSGRYAMYRHPAARRPVRADPDGLLRAEMTDAGPVLVVDVFDADAPPDIVTKAI